MPFTFFDHTGDIGVDLSATTLAALFADAATALTEVLVDRRAVRPLSPRPLAVEHETVDGLLVEWLSELLYVFEVEGWVAGATEVRIERAGKQFRADATLRGEPLDPVRHGPRGLIKAVTYHGLHVTQGPDGWTARVIFDV